MKTPRKVQKENSKNRFPAQQTNTFENEAASAILLGRPHLEAELERFLSEHKHYETEPSRMLDLADVFRSLARQLRANKIACAQLVQAKRWSAEKRQRMAAIFDRWASQLWLKAGWMEPELEEDASPLNPTERLALADKLERWAEQLRLSAAVLDKMQPLWLAAERLARN